MEIGKRVEIGFSPEPFYTVEKKPSQFFCEGLGLNNEREKNGKKKQ